MDLELNIRPGSIGFTLIWKTIIIFVHAKSSEGCGGASYSWRWLQALGLNLLSQTRAQEVTLHGTQGKEQMAQGVCTAFQVKCPWKSQSSNSPISIPEAGMPPHALLVSPRLSTAPHRAELVLKRGKITLVASLSLLLYFFCFWAPSSGHCISWLWGEKNEPG